MKKIIIIEDNQIIAENFERILGADFEISKAASAGEAISKIDQTLPNLILLDILLEGHSAFALLNELQSYSDTAKIPVVVCSDLSDELDTEALKKYGVRQILDKSKIRPREILEVCRNEAN
ncbi:MAG: response regulator [bacterium]|nr:response regulator [bacterium]